MSVSTELDLDITHIYLFFLFYQFYHPQVSYSTKNGILVLLLQRKSLEA